MNLNQERYFFISGLISLSLFIVFLFLAGYSLIVSPKIEQFAMIQSDVINVSIALSDTKASEQKEPEPKVEPQKVEPAPEKAVESVVEPEKTPEISDLFAQVKPQKIAKKPLEDSKQNEQLNRLEKELLTHKNTPNFTDKVNKVELAKPSVKMVVQGGSSGPLVDKYYAKIKAIVRSYFHPPAGTGGEVAKVRISFSASGKLISYTVISYSSNRTLNSEADWLKDRLFSIHFPEHPDGKDAILDFILTPEEKF